MRNSPKHCRFPKAKRFPTVVPDNNAKFENFPTIVSAKYSTIGYGDRIFLKELPGSVSPPPSQYKIGSTFESKDRLKGKTFGISREYYDKVYIPGIENLASGNSEYIPGPGKYNHTIPFGKNAVKATMKSKYQPCVSGSKDFPAPNNYRLAHSLVEPSRFGGASIGFGDRGCPHGPPSKMQI